VSDVETSHDDGDVRTAGADAQRIAADTEIWALIAEVDAIIRAHNERARSRRFVLSYAAYGAAAGA
jgi:hypothetical protein